MIPNIIHFVLISETDFKQDFLYMYYLSILSAKIVNNPDKIYFYYNFIPKGYYWDMIKDILTLEQIELPGYIGKKPLIKMAHKADIIRMNKLSERGGVYFDIDTISYRPYKHLLENSCVLGIQDEGEICNAILMTEANHSFFKQWMDVYEMHFQSHGWAEASILLPWKLYHSNGNNQIVKLMPKETFFNPGWRNPEQIFQENIDVSPELITLHLWNTQSQRFIKQINNKSWFEKNPHTLYTKIYRSLNI